MEYENVEMEKYTHVYSHAVGRLMMILSVLSRRPAVTAVVMDVAVVVVMVMRCRDVGAEMHGNGVRSDHNDNDVADEEDEMT